MKYVTKKSARAMKTPGSSMVAVGKKPKLGAGGRFQALKTGLAKRGAKNPGGLAAFIGRKKYGQKKMTAMAVAGKKRK